MTRLCATSVVSRQTQQTPTKFSSKGSGCLVPPEENQDLEKNGGGNYPTFVTGQEMVGLDEGRIFKLYLTSNADLINEISPWRFKGTEEWRKKEIKRQVVKEKKMQQTMANPFVSGDV
ncbi:hypothetical protein BVRB_2g034630 [Beta vulgaris subsp. vulgaris]|nr:hypothetical protein BVRB_2g034630 [Beta vulgaris subsp. vulgaris]